MSEEKIIRSYKGFNSKIYNSKADIGEKNSGEYMVDATGYIPLQQLLARCGINPNINIDVDIPVREGLDKFNDNTDLAQDVIDRFNRAEEIAVKQFLDKKNSVKSQKPQEENEKVTTV